MEEKEYEKYNTVKIHSHINEVMVLSEVTQYFKNNSNFPIELSIELSELTNCIITKFEMILDDQKIVSKILEKEKAEEKYNDAIASGNAGFISYSKDKKTTVCLGNVPSKKEVELKTHYFGNLLCNDLSYQAIFPTIFPTFIIHKNEFNKNSNNSQQNYNYVKQIVIGKIEINCFYKIKRLIIKGSSNFDKIDKKYLNDDKSVEINILKNSFSNEDIPGIILFRTEKINDDYLFYQYDPQKDLDYYLFQKTAIIPELDIKENKTIDENEELKYISLNKSKIKLDNKTGCYIFLLDQSWSMSGRAMELCRNALMLFLQSLNKGSYFQLIGFGSSFEYYNNKPLEYTKENVTKLMEIIKKLYADKGGTELFNPLESIFKNPIYEEYNIIKHIFVLTDGEISDKEKTLNLIGSYSDKFTLHSLGIGNYYDNDLIKRIAIMGNGNSFFCNKLNDINKNVINALEQSQIANIISVNFEVMPKPYIEYNNKQLAGIYDFMRYGFILNNKNNNSNINISLEYNKIKKTFKFNNSNINKLANGDELGKIIVNYYLKNNKSIDKTTEIKLSKEFNILSTNTAFFAEIQNEIPVQEDIATLSNENKVAMNNNNSKKLKLINDTDTQNNLALNEFNSVENINELKNLPNESKPKKKCFCNLFSNLFIKKNKINNNKNNNIIISINRYNNKLNNHNIINTKQNNSNLNSKASINSSVRHCNYEKQQRSVRHYKYDKKESSIRKKDYDDYDVDVDGLSQKRDCYIDADSSLPKNAYYEDNDDLCVKSELKSELSSEDMDCNYNKNKKPSQNNKDSINGYDNINFNELILSQDIFEGNWSINENETKKLIEKEKEIFEKIKKFSEEKNIKDENGIITLLILYYIYNKEPEKVEELKFVINKAKLYIKKIYNLEYEDISKEFI